MKYLFINSVYGKRSTGKIITDKCHELQSEGSECMVAYGRECIDDKTVQLVRIGSTADQFLHALLSRIFDNQGFCSAIDSLVFRGRVCAVCYHDYGAIPYCIAEHFVRYFREAILYCNRSNLYSHKSIFVGSCIECID